MAQLPHPVPPLKTSPAAKLKLEEIVRAWAATLTPQNAPEGKFKGPLAWVRETRAEDLIKELIQAGYGK